MEIKIANMAKMKWIAEKLRVLASVAGAAIQLLDAFNRIGCATATTTAATIQTKCIAV